MEIKLNDLRRYAIVNSTRITSHSRRDGRVCVVNIKGIVEIPGIAGPPPYNIEDVLKDADEFVCEPREGKPLTHSREAMAELLKKVAPAAAAASKEE